MSVQVHGIDIVVNQLQKMPPALETRVIREMSQIVYDQAQRGADAHTKTGALFRSTYNRAIPGGREVGHDPKKAPHAVFVHWGTRPHVIRPKYRKALRFQPGGGQFVFAKFVNHPGYKGDPWLVRAADFAVKQMATIVANATKGL